MLFTDAQIGTPCMLNPAPRQTWETPYSPNQHVSPSLLCRNNTRGDKHHQLAPLIVLAIVTKKMA